MGGRVLGVLILCLSYNSSGAELGVIEIVARKLEGNPLGDSTVRRAAVLSPDDTPADRPLPLVIYLPGWGGSPDESVNNHPRSIQASVVQRMASHGSPLRIAVVDGRSRYGGSQFINSPATGNYADYVVEDVLREIERKYATTKDRRFIGGHSSGGYGALMLAMSHKREFNGVIALSPDSDFETTHKPIVQEPSVRATTQTDVEAAMAPLRKYRLPRDGTALLVMGLSANYAATRNRPGRFEWLYDDRGQWREDVWQRWVALDPLTLVQRDPKAFDRSEPVYLDGAQFDEYGANLGARRIYDVLKARSQTVTFYESPGHHSDALSERLERGLRWALANVDAFKSAK
jgi:S-formylglutathione hydrolase FrmB